MAPGRVARWFEMHLADELGVRPGGRPLRRVRPPARGRRALPLGAAARRRPVRALPGPAARPGRPVARGAQAPQGVPAPGRRGARGAPAARRRWSARSRSRCASSSRTRSIARRARSRSSTRSGARRRGAPRSPRGSRSSRASHGDDVELRDIVTEDDDEAAIGLRVGAGPGALPRRGWSSHFEDAIADPEACPRIWSVHDGDRSSSGSR